MASRPARWPSSLHRPPAEPAASPGHSDCHSEPSVRNPYLGSGFLLPSVVGMTFAKQRSREGDKMEDGAMPILEGAIFWDNDRLRQDRLARIQDQMKRRNVGALLLGTGPKARYVMNLQVPGASVFVPVNGEPLAVVRPRDLGYVRLQFPN